jgi:hypothetical protein
MFPEVERGTYLIVRTDGTEKLVRVKPTSEAISRAIGADVVGNEILTWRQGPPILLDKAAMIAAAKALGFDHVLMLDADFERLRQGLRADLIMCVDDKGYEAHKVETPGHTTMVADRARLPVNQKASEWYWAVCKPEYREHPVVGDVVLARDQDFAKR